MSILRNNSGCNFAFARKEEQPTPELTEEDEEWLEASLQDLQEWDEDHATDQVLNEMENVIRAIEFYIIEYEKHTPSPSQEGS